MKGTQRSGCMTTTAYIGEPIQALSSLHWKLPGQNILISVALLSNVQALCLFCSTPLLSAIVHVLKRVHIMKEKTEPRPHCRLFWGERIMLWWPRAHCVLACTLKPFPMCLTSTTKGYPKGYTQPICCGAERVCGPVSRLKAAGNLLKANVETKASRKSRVVPCPVAENLLQMVPKCA